MLRNMIGALASLVQLRGAPVDHKLLRKLLKRPGLLGALHETLVRRYPQLKKMKRAEWLQFLIDHWEEILKIVLALLAL